MESTLVGVRANAKQAPAPGSEAALAFRSATGGGGDFGSKVALFLLDAFAELEAHEALQGKRRAHILARGGDDFGGRGLPTDHGRLRERRIFLAVLCNGAVDHLRDNNGGFARL